MIGILEKRLFLNIDERGVEMNLYIISTCLKKKKGIYFFHFKGAYRGSYITEVRLSSDSELEIGEEYALFVQKIDIQDSILYAKVKKFKKLF